jgi:hypothetical protein
MAIRLLSSADVKNILNQYDIEGLLEIGAPNDEYESEAQDIASALNELEQNYFDAEHIFALIMDIWQKNFELAEDDLLKRKEFFAKVVNAILAIGKNNDEVG